MTSTSSDAAAPNFMVKDRDCRICAAIPDPSGLDIGPWEHTSSSKLLTLPCELRDIIYQYALCYDQFEEFTHAELELPCYEQGECYSHVEWEIPALPMSKRLQFLLTCRQIYHEAHRQAFEATSFDLRLSWLQGRTKLITIMNEQLLGNMDEIEVRHLKSCHDSELYQKLFRLPPSKIAHLKRFSFFLSTERYTPEGCKYVFPELPMHFLLFRKLSLTTITLSAAGGELALNFYLPLFCTILELIGSMESLEHIQWFESMSGRAVGQVDETLVARFRRIFPTFFVRNYGWGWSDACIRRYQDISELIHCTPADEETKTAVLAVNGKWCYDGTKDHWQTCSSWRNVRVTVATFDEAKALPPA